MMSKMGLHARHGGEGCAHLGGRSFLETWSVYLLENGTPSSAMADWPSKRSAMAPARRVTIQEFTFEGELVVGHTAFAQASSNWPTNGTSSKMPQRQCAHDRLGQRSPTRGGRGRRGGRSPKTRGPEANCSWIASMKSQGPDRQDRPAKVVWE